MKQKRIYGLSSSLFALILACYVFSYPAIAISSQNNQESEMNNDNICYNTTDNQDKETPTLLSSFNFVTDFVIPLCMQTLGVLGGFWSAIAISRLTNKQQRQELDISLRNEIETIRDELASRLAQKEDFSWYQYSIPVWEINLASGSLSSLANHCIYKKYIGVYSKIQYAQELEKEYTHSKLLEGSYAASTKDSFLKKYIASTDEARKDSAKSIYEMILELLKDVK